MDQGSSTRERFCVGNGLLLSAPLGRRSVLHALKWRILAKETMSVPSSGRIISVAEKYWKIIYMVTLLHHMSLSPRGS
jgi:hypothetical protein